MKGTNADICPPLGLSRHLDFVESPQTGREWVRTAPQKTCQQVAMRASPSTKHAMAMLGSRSHALSSTLRFTSWQAWKGRRFATGKNMSPHLEAFLVIPLFDQTSACPEAASLDARCTYPYKLAQAEAEHRCIAPNLSATFLMLTQRWLVAIPVAVRVGAAP